MWVGLPFLALSLHILPYRRPAPHVEPDGDWMMKRIDVLISTALVLSAFTQKSDYEVAVEDMEPVYCFKTLAGVQCY